MKVVAALIVATVFVGCAKRRERAPSSDLACVSEGSAVFRVAYLYRGADDREAMAKLREDRCSAAPAAHFKTDDEVAIIGCCPE